MSPWIFFLIFLLILWLTMMARTEPSIPVTAGRGSKNYDRFITRVTHLANAERFDDAIGMCKRLIRRARNPTDRRNAAMAMTDIRTEVKARRNEERAHVRTQRQLETLQVNEVDPLQTFPELFPTWEDHFVWETAHPIHPIYQPVPLHTDIRDDPQNVHDSAVQDDIVAAILHMETFATHVSWPSTTRLMEAIGRMCLSDKRESALMTLNYIQVNQAATLSRLENLERIHTIGQVFSVIVQYIDAQNEQNEGEVNEPEDKNGEQSGVNKREILYDMLALELADCHREDGGLLCLTGIVTRIVATFDGLDEKIHVRPEWAIKAELMNRAGMHHAGGCEPEEIRRRLHEEYDSQIGPQKLEGYIAGWLESL